MKLVINNIQIKNFKGCSELKLNFMENKNILEGENGIGKTTVLDAITWCLFGKNFADEKQFKIKPIIDGEEKEDLATSVLLIINDTKIERIWNNSLTTIKVDDVKFGVTEFNNYLRDKFFITDAEFKALSNIDYIPNLHWKELRSLIMGLIGEIKNEEVFVRGDFNLIRDKIESVGVEKTAEDIKTSKSELASEIKVLQGNIDQKHTDIQQLVVDDNEQQQLEERKQEIKATIESFNILKEKKAAQDAEISKLTILEGNLKANINTRDNLLKDNVEYQKTYNSSNIDVELIKTNKIKEKTNQIESINQDIERLELEKSSLIADREELRSRYDEEVKREIKVENSTCTACGQPLPGEKIKEVLNNLKEESKARANLYVAKAKEKLTRMSEIDVVINSYKEKISQVKKEIDEIKTEEIDSTQESSVQIQMKNNITRNKEKIANLEIEALNIQKQINLLKDSIKNHKVINVGDTSSLQNELETITEKLAISATLKIFKEQLKELEAKYADKLSEKERLNEREQQLILFNSTKTELLRERVKHNFKLADFITQEETKDGKLVETFKIAVDGIEYNALNAGHKILVALDLIDNIQRMKNKRLPILIDGLGELTRLPELETQIIGCRAKYQANKKLEVVNQ